MAGQASTALVYERIRHKRILAAVAGADPFAIETTADGEQIPQVSNSNSVMDFMQQR